MRVAAIQHDIVWEQGEQTRAHVRPMIAEAAAGGARLIVLSEMYATGFSMEPERIAEDEGGPNEQFLIDAAAEHGAHVIASIAQRGADGQYRNNAVLARPDGTVTRYAKIHPFTFAGEHERYAAGTGHCTVDVDGLRVSLFVCYDLRFADEFWATALDTDCYVVVANWPAPRRDHWRTLLRARAIENQAFVVGTNRIGSGGRLDYAGDSAIVLPFGKALEASGGGVGWGSEEILLHDVTADEVAETRAKWPFLQDRRDEEDVGGGEG